MPRSASSPDAPLARPIAVVTPGREIVHVADRFCGFGVVAQRVFEVGDEVGEGDHFTVGGDRVAFGAEREDFAFRPTDAVDQGRHARFEITLVDVRFFAPAFLPAGSCRGWSRRW